MLADGRAGPGSWVRAETQSAGRGRLSRAWQSPPGNLYTSGAIGLRADEPPAATLALAIALAVRDAAMTLAPGRALRLKWPNDLMMGDAKVAGILLQRQGDCVIAGVGLNLAHAPDVPGRRTAALGPHDPADALHLLIDACAARVAQWRGDFSATRLDWIAGAHPVGTPLSVTLPDDAAVHGTFAGLAADGALMLMTPGGAMTIHAGDVALGGAERAR